MSERHTIGYTVDGMVFVAINSSYQGEKFQTLIQWHPDEARSFAKSILESANEADLKRQGVIDGGNGSNFNKGGA